MNGDASCNDFETPWKSLDEEMAGNVVVVVEVDVVVVVVFDDGKPGRRRDVEL